MPGVTTAYQSGNHAGRPAANSGCILYSCSDHNLVYRSDGSAWTTWATLVSGGGATTGWRRPVQEVAAGWNATTLTMAAPTNGNVVLAMFILESTQRVSSITQTNVTWTRLAETTVGTAPRCEVWAGVAAASAGTGITVAYSDAGNGGWMIAEFNGLAGTLDQSASQVNFTQAWADFPVVTPTDPEALVLTVLTATNFGGNWDVWQAADMLKFRAARYAAYNFGCFFGFPGQEKTVGWASNGSSRTSSALTVSVI